MIGELWRRLRYILGGLIGELSDESAYARHLAACGRTHSAEEWRRFSDARHGAKYTRPKCC
ncbi:MAG: hypothetical protein JSU00_05420 [Acidobacteria bacterium]|nr:hypothetical protein [Acidobacteriota bacterium]